MQEMNSRNTTISQDFNDTNTGLLIHLKTDEDDVRPVYISGNFNNWRTQDKDFLMEHIGNNLYLYEFPNDFDYPKELFYKFCGGYGFTVYTPKAGRYLMLNSSFFTIC